MNAARQILEDQLYEKAVEVRIARLESDVEHIKLDMQDVRAVLKAANESIALLRADVSAVKATLPHLATKDELRSVEGSLNARMNALEAKLIRWIVGTAIAATAVGASISKFV